MRYQMTEFQDQRETTNIEAHEVQEDPGKGEHIAYFEDGSGNEV